MRQADVESGYRFVEGLQRLRFATSVRSVCLNGAVHYQGQVQPVVGS